MTHQMKPSTIQNVRGKNAEILTQLVREHHELIDLCRDFAKGIWASEDVDGKYVSTGTKEEGLNYLREHPESIVAISRDMTPQAFVSFTKALQKVMPQMYVTTHLFLAADVPIVIDAHPKPSFIRAGIPSSISYRLWSKEPEIDPIAGHPDWNEYIGILEAYDPYDYYRDENHKLKRRLMSQYDPLQKLQLRFLGTSLGGYHAPGGTTIYQVRTSDSEREG